MLKSSTASNMDYIGHTTQTAPVVCQELKVHLKAVGELCAQYAAPAGLEHAGRLIGMLHDAGKYSDAFQKHIKAQDHAQVNHAFAGARVLLEELNAQGILNTADPTPDQMAIQALVNCMLNAIMAHHNRLGPYNFFNPEQTPDGIDHNNKSEKEYETEIEKNIFPFYFNLVTKTVDDWTIDEIHDRFFAKTEMDRQAFVNECQLMVQEAKQIGMSAFGHYQFFYQRFLASCLVDADHTDTANFSIGRANETSISSERLSALNQINEASILEFSHQSVANESTRILNQARQQMSDLCASAGDGKMGLYSLSVPTGGGKTISGLRFGLHQAQAHRFDQIIYVAPFTTIIEQNAKVMRSMLKVPADDMSTVLEYHSNVVDDQKIDQELYRLARDAWDAPIVVTTQVAYFNALFGKGSRNLRHMHRLVNSVIIEDEVQTLPIKLLGLHNAFINWVTELVPATVLLCTATQPELGHHVLQHGLDHQPVEIVKDVDQTAGAFERTQLVTHLDGGGWSLDQLNDFLHEQLTRVESILVILNTKSAVKKAYDLFNDDDVRKYHLSTNMCPANRQRRFEQIRWHLSKPDGKKLIVFSTRLIEAGVDLSFEMVVRSLAGLDSVTQAAGRCNRNHETAKGEVHLIEMLPSVERMSSLQLLKKGGEVTASVHFRHRHENLMLPSLVSEYFAAYYGYFDEQHLTKYPLGNGAGNLYDWGNPVHESELVANAEQYQATILSLRGKVQTPEDVDSVVNADGVMSMAPQSIAQHFQVIASETEPMIVGYDPNDDFEEGEPKPSQHLLSGVEIIVKLNSGTLAPEEIPQLLQQAQQFTVQLYDHAEVAAVGSFEFGQRPGINYTMDYSSETGVGGDLSKDAFVF